MSRFGFHLDIKMIKDWLKMFGTVEGEGQFLDHDLAPIKVDTVTIPMRLRKRIPSVLPVYGRKMSVHYHGQPKVCGACFSVGHVRKNFGKRFDKLVVGDFNIHLDNHNCKMKIATDYWADNSDLAQFFQFDT